MNASDSSLILVFGPELFKQHRLYILRLIIDKIEYGAENLLILPLLKFLFGNLPHLQPLNNLHRNRLKIPIPNRARLPLINPPLHLPNLFLT